MDKKMIKKGDLFAINYASLHCWDKVFSYVESPDGEDYTDIDIIDLKSVSDDKSDYARMLIVKYVGHGYVEEMLSGLKIRTMNIPNVFKFEDQDTIETIWDEEGILELDNFKKYFNNKLNRFTKTDKTSMIENLECLSKTIKESPLAYLDDTDFVFELDEEIKNKYKKVSDEERLKYLADLIKHSSKNAEKCIDIINESIEKTKIIKDENVEEDALEEQINNFSKRNINYRFRDYLQELATFVNKEDLSEDERKNITEEIQILKTAISQLQIKHGISEANESVENNISNTNGNKNFK